MKRVGRAATPSMSPVGPDWNRVQAILQVHTAEYAALTTRATYYVVLGSAIWALIVPFLILVVQVWQAPLWQGVLGQMALAWGSALLVQVIMVNAANVLLEQYMIVLYVETDLRSRIRALVGDESVWGYEQFLSRRRGTGPAFWELGIPILGVVPPAVVVLLRRAQWSSLDYVGLGGAVVLVIGLLLTSRKVIQTRGKWVRSFDVR